MNPFVSFVKGLDSHPDFHDKMFSFAWLEGRIKAEIGKIEDLTDWNEIEKWPAGRIFGSKGEYHWQLDKNNKIHAVLILDEGHLPEKFRPVPLKL